MNVYEYLQSHNSTIMILVINQINVQILFYNKFIICTGAGDVVLQSVTIPDAE